MGRDKSAMAMPFRGMERSVASALPLVPGAVNVLDVAVGRAITDDDDDEAEGIVDFAQWVRGSFDSAAAVGVVVVLLGGATTPFPRHFTHPKARRTLLRL